MSFLKQQKIIEMVTALSEYYSKKISAFSIDHYVKALDKFDLSAIDRAVRMHIADPEHGSFMPKISDLMRYLSGSSRSDAADAWTKVDRAIREIGPYQTVIFDDELIHATIESMGGWIYLCNAKDETDLSIKSHEFIKRYKSFFERGIDGFLPKLVGMTDAQNSALESYEPMEPRYIGLKSKALKVFQSGTNRMRLEHDDTAQKLDDVVLKLAKK